MPVCGFNQKMLEGLSALHEGLVEHGLIERSKIRKQTVSQTIDREFSDMERFLRETNRIADPEVREMTEAITQYARAFYNLIQSRGGIENYQQTIRELNDFYVEMDRKYYEELEGKHNSMRNLAEHLNEIRI